MNLPDRHQLTLYQLPISHYCEKVRWSLDYKKAKYRTVNLLPGPHARVARKLSGASHLPILQHHENVVNESSAILAYLDSHFTERSLLPSNASLHDEMCEWEAFADEQIGPHVRRVCYYTVLDHKKICVSYLSQNGPWYGRFLVSALYPKLKAIMRRSMKINRAETTRSEQTIRDSLHRIHSRLEGRRYLVGDTFSRADLAVSALLAPLCRPVGYPIDWTGAMAEPLNSFYQELAPQLQFVVDNYAAHRGVRL